MSYTIGSFNMGKANYRSDEKQKKDYMKIATIIKDENFDVVALQEVQTKGVLKHFLLPALGNNEWDFCWDTRKSYSSQSAEGYAYIWKNSIFRLVEANSNPIIVDGYDIKNNAKDIKTKGLIRPPFLVRLTTEGVNSGPFMELRFINTHIICDKPKGITESCSKGGLRRKELKILAEQIYPRFADDRCFANNMPAYTIMMGDYNLCLVGPSPKLEEEMTICSYPDQTRQDRKLITVQKELSSLKRPENVDEKAVFPEYYANDYDHFSYEKSLEQKLKPKVSRVEALGKYYNNNLKDYRREISDHVPIKLIINLK